MSVFRPCSSTVKSILNPAARQETIDEIWRFVFVNVTRDVILSAERPGTYSRFLVVVFFYLLFQSLSQTFLYFNEASHTVTNINR